MVPSNRRRAAKTRHRLIVLQQQLVDLTEVIRGDGVVRIDVERLLEQRGGAIEIALALLALHWHEVHEAQRRSAREQQLLALIVEVLRRLLDLTDVADAEAHR